jgi:glucosamine-6-phosphate deaminase
MHLLIHSTPEAANGAAADLLAERLIQPGTRTLMAAAGNTPLEVYRRIAQRDLPLAHLLVFALDEYLGVPLEHPRNCGSLLRQSVAEAWNIPSSQFRSVSSLEENALPSIVEHEREIAERGGLDVLVLGLGQNGHLGFNEPGSPPDSKGRIVDLEAISVEANRQWFHGEYAPKRGVTVGLRTILAAKTILLLAYGSHKAAATVAMIEGPRTTSCPASWLQTHPDIFVFLDQAAAARLKTPAGKSSAGPI